MTQKLAGIYKRVCPSCNGELEIVFKSGSLVYCPKCKVYTGSKDILVSVWDENKQALVPVKFKEKESFIFR